MENKVRVFCENCKHFDRRDLEESGIVYNCKATVYRTYSEPSISPIWEDSGKIKTGFAQCHVRNAHQDCRYYIKCTNWWRSIQKWMWDNL